MISSSTSKCPDCSALVREPVFGVRKPNRVLFSDEMLCPSCNVPLLANTETPRWYSAPYVDPEFIDDYYSGRELSATG